jgi:hypothetical protein
MNRLRVSVAGTVLFLVVAVTCVLITSHKSAAQNPNSGPDVHIVSPLPLPVMGTLSFATGSTVTVDNPASSPVLVRDVDRGKPFQRYNSFIGTGNAFHFGPVPAGERWNVEHVSIDASALNPGTGFAFTRFTLTTTSEGAAAVDVLIPQQTAPGEFLANSQTKIISDPGARLEIVAEFIGEPGGIRLSAFISGVIVPAP